MAFEVRLGRRPRRDRRPAATVLSAAGSRHNRPLPVMSGERAENVVAQLLRKPKQPRQT